MSLTQDLQELDLKDLDKLAFAPKPVKIAVIALACLVILGAMAWFFALPKVQEIESLRDKEHELRRIYVDEQRKAANLEAYREQLSEMEFSLGSMLEQLPNRTQIDALLAEVARLGRATGLTIETFRPVDEQRAEFYVEHIIELVVTGTYDQFGAFSEALAGTSRIVNLREFQVQRQDVIDGLPEVDNNLLRANMRIVTYRYQPEQEDRETRR